jgi:hypothetical protein
MEGLQRNPVEHNVYGRVEISMIICSSVVSKYSSPKQTLCATGLTLCTILQHAMLAHVNDVPISREPKTWIVAWRFTYAIS